MTNHNPSYKPSPYERMGRKDYKLANALNWNDMMSDEMKAKTLMYQNKYGFSTASADGSPTHNNQADAFKHAFMSAVLVLRNGGGFSKASGDLHEYVNILQKADPAESNMDLWNNGVGRSIALNLVRNLKKQGIDPYSMGEKQLEDWVAESVSSYMQQGKLITDPKDKRKYNSTKFFQIENKKREPIPNLVYTLEKVKKLTQNEFHLDSPAIMAQGRIGYPTEEQAKKLVSEGKLDYVHPHDGFGTQISVTSGGKVWVEPYTRADGTEVDGYYRSKPNGLFA